VAEDAGATVNQVVLAWLIDAEIPMIALVGASSVAQLDESLAAVDLGAAHEAGHDTVNAACRFQVKPRPNTRTAAGVNRFRSA